jgi:hypothetical protein
MRRVHEMETVSENIFISFFYVVDFSGSLVSGVFFLSQ